MVRHVAHDFADALPLAIGVGAKIVVERVEEIVAVEFIAAGVGLPKPFSVGAPGPARLIDFPEFIALPFLAITFQPAHIRVGPLHRPDGAGDKAFGRRWCAALRDFLQEPQRFEGLFFALLGLWILGCSIGEAFAGAVSRRPEAVVVAVQGRRARLVPRLAQGGFSDEPERRALDVVLDLLLVKLRLLRQRHRAALDAAHTSGRGKPGPALPVHSHLRHLIVRQPARTLAVMPLLAVEPNRAQACAKPDLRLNSGSYTRELVPRQTVLAFVELPTVGCATPHARKAGKPELALRVESNTKRLFHRPGPPAAVLNADRHPTALLLLEQAAVGGDVQHAGSRDRDLIDAQSARPAAGSQFPIHNGEHLVGRRQDLGRTKAEELSNATPRQPHFQSLTFCVGEAELLLGAGR